MASCRSYVKIRFRFVLLYLSLFLVSHGPRRRFCSRRAPIIPSTPEPMVSCGSVKELSLTPDCTHCFLLTFVPCAWLLFFTRRRSIFANSVAT